MLFRSVESAFAITKWSQIAVPSSDKSSEITCFAFLSSIACAMTSTDEIRFIFGAAFFFTVVVFFATTGFEAAFFTAAVFVVTFFAAVVFFAAVAFVVTFLTVVVFFAAAVFEVTFFSAVTFVVIFFAFAGVFVVVLAVA